MNSRHKRIYTAIASLALAVSTFTFAAPPDAQGLADIDPAQKAATDDMQAANTELISLFDHGAIFGDATKRAEAAPKAIPLLKRIKQDMETLQAHGVSAAQLGSMRFQQLAMLDYFGDGDTSAKLATDAAGTDDAAVEAGTALALSHWWKGAHDDAAQQKALEELKALAKTHADDNRLAIALMTMNNTASPSAATRDAAAKILADDLKGPLAQRFAASNAAEQKLRALEGKPLVITGKLMDGGELTTSAWKGKVILVDFWASWCGPCKAELPRVKKAYADYHAKGLEVIGVSCDQGAGPLHEFLQKNPDMPWPQLFDSEKPGWHEIAKDFGINGIPTMFLIDKAGTVRTVTARENFEELIPKMLDEK